MKKIEMPYLGVFGFIQNHLNNFILNWCNGGCWFILDQWVYIQPMFVKMFGYFSISWRRSKWMTIIFFVSKSDKFISISLNEWVTFHLF